MPWCLSVQQMPKQRKSKTYSGKRDELFSSIRWLTLIWKGRNWSRLRWMSRLQQLKRRKLAYPSMALSSWRIYRWSTCLRIDWRNSQSPCYASKSWPDFTSMTTTSLRLKTSNPVSTSSDSTWSAIWFKGLKDCKIAASLKSWLSRSKSCQEM